MGDSWHQKNREWSFLPWVSAGACTGTLHLHNIFILLLLLPLSHRAVQEPPQVWTLVSHSEFTSHVFTHPKRLDSPQHEVGLDGRSALLRMEKGKVGILFLISPDSFPCQGHCF